MSLVHGNSGLQLLVIPEISFKRDKDICLDLSGKNNHGDIIGNYITLDSGGIDFTGGSTGYLEFPEIVPTRQLSLCCFFKHPTFSGEAAGLITKHESYILGFLSLTNTTIRNLIHTTGTSAWTSATDIVYPFEPDTWYYECYTYRSGRMNYYINGELIQSITNRTGDFEITSTGDGTKVRIGGRAQNGWHFGGVIGVSQIYTKQISHKEIMMNYNKYKGLYGL